MSSATLAARPDSPATLAPHYIRELPILVLFPHSRCNCRCVMCDIWRIRQVREITVADLEPHLAGLRQLRVRWVVFSGGEPLMASHLPALARKLRDEGIRTTLLTAGLILAQHADAVAELMDDVIVSLDGPAEIHDRIRGVPRAFDRLKQGIYACRQRRASLPIHGRCTVQKENFRQLRALIPAARELQLDSLSFLAADVTSEAFNRPVRWTENRTSHIALDAAEADEVEDEIEALIREYNQEIHSGFIREDPEKLRSIARRFRCHLGQLVPLAPRCNAPWVSAVIEADGTVRPCFFHRPVGNIQEGPLAEILNGSEAVGFRSQLDVAHNEICQRCVCSLFLDAGHANR